MSEDQNLPTEGSTKKLIEQPVETSAAVFKGKTPAEILNDVKGLIEKKGKGKDTAKVGLMLMVLDEVKETKKALDAQRKDARGKKVTVDLTQQTRRWLTSVQFLYESLNDLDMVKFEYEDLQEISSYLLNLFKGILESHFDFSEQQMNYFVDVLRKKAPEIDTFIAQVASRKRNQK